MPTVQDIYDIAVYAEAQTESAKLRAIIHMIVRRRPNISAREILTWSTIEFYQTAKDIVEAVDPNHTQVPTAFAHAFECKKPCCQDSNLITETRNLLNRWVHTTTLENFDVKTEMQSRCKNDTNFILAELQKC